MLLIICACAALAQLAGCGQVGLTCPTSGSTEGCADGLVCTFVLIDGEIGDPDRLPPVKVCLQQCETSKDCAEGEVCRVVFCTDDFKSCQTGAQPDFPSDLCDTRSAEDAAADPG